MNYKKKMMIKPPLKKIVVFGSLPSGFGGMEKVFIEFASFFNLKQDYSLQFYMYELNDGNDYTWLETIHYTLYQPNIRFRLLQKMKVIHHFKTFLNENKPDIIIAYDPLSVFLAKKTLDKSRLRSPIFSWIHFSFTRFKPKYQKYTLLANYHLAICDTIKKQLVNKSAPENRCHVIYNPIPDQTDMIPRPTEKVLSILYMGRVQYQDQKNLKELFVALGSLNKPFCLHIVGSGALNELDQLKNLATELNIQNKITWHGWQQDPWHYVKEKIKTVSTLVLTSTYEGFPMTLCEAMSRGIFCISSDCETGPRDILSSVNGILYPPADIARLKGSLESVYDPNNIPSAEKIKQSVTLLHRKEYFSRLENIFESITK